MSLTIYISVQLALFIAFLHRHTDCTGWSRKNAQNSVQHRFATVHQKVMRFTAKCSERNCLDDNSPYLNTAITFFFVLQLAS